MERSLSRRKDACHIYYSIRNFPSGPDGIVETTSAHLDVATPKGGYFGVLARFSQVDGLGPTGVRRFVSTSDLLGEHADGQWQPDTFGQVKA